MPEFYTLYRDEFTISTDPARLDFEVIHDFISRDSYWGKGISRAQMQQQIDHSTFNFGIYHGPRQVGFAQVLTNFVTFAYLGNVFVVDEFRGRGLSKWLMEVITTHPDLQRLRRWVLATRDAHGLYAQFGFTPLRQPETFMERVDDAWPGQPI
ncbi:MAG: GNAT family N-acetyltransferase [Cytophagaceae bacterium]|nr:GNAT family N-acetyltransferase [Cytophagaceae bacterium]